MSLGAMGRMFGLGALSKEQAARRGLEAATSEHYRAENPEAFERIVQKRLSDSPTLASYYAQAKAGWRFDGSAQAGRVGSPALVVHGAQDRLVPPSNARALAETILGAALRILDRAGHLVFIERASQVNQQVLEFLGGAEQRRSTPPRVAPDRRE